MEDPTLLRLIAEAARRMAAGEHPAEVLHSVAAAAGADPVVDEAGALDLHWMDGAGADDARQAFASALAELTALGRQVLAPQAQGILDPQAFLSELQRCAAAARWRDGRLALCVFDVDGLALGPGNDESRLVALVGSAARAAVRQGDLVGHLGASRFGILFPRAGTFEARAAFRRVRDRVGELDVDGEGLACGSAGYAELESEDGDLLAEGVARLHAARVRQAYTGGPVGPGAPTTPLAG